MKMQSLVFVGSVLLVGAHQWLMCWAAANNCLLSKRTSTSSETLLRSSLLRKRV